MSYNYSEKIFSIEKKFFFSTPSENAQFSLKTWGGRIDAKNIHIASSLPNMFH